MVDGKRASVEENKSLRLRWELGFKIIILLSIHFILKKTYFEPLDKLSAVYFSFHFFFFLFFVFTLFTNFLPYLKYLYNKKTNNK